MFRQIAADSKFWYNVRNKKEYEVLIKRLFELYDEYCTGDIPESKFSEYKLYFETGNRNVFEKNYFFKRRRMNTLAILSLIYPDNKEYIEKLQDTIWAVCNEYSWVLPAHTKAYPHTEYNIIDLFSAETGFALSEIKYLLNNRLNDLINKRIDEEVKKRILDVFTLYEQSWEKWDNNWAAVCSASVAASFMYQEPESYCMIKRRISDAMDIFLSGYPDDGTCLEGIAYWEYGFGFYLWYAELLYDFTDGKENLFLNEKLKNISLFAQKTYLTDNVTVSFSDSTSNARIVVGITHFLKNMYGDEIRIIPSDIPKTDDHCGRWCHHVRSFVFYNPVYNNSKFNGNCEYYLKDANWYIKRTAQYSFAIKAGSNAEPHNHNDIGSFIIAKDNRQIFTDLGCGEYTKEYFNPETRYSILCNSSFGHSVPVINGKGQKEGRNFFGTMHADDNGITVDLKNAYEDSTLKKLERRIETYDKYLKITDCFDFKNKGSYVCRLITYDVPKTDKGKIVVNNATVKFDGDIFEAVVKCEKHITHMPPEEISVYVIDLKPLKDENCIELTVEFE